MDDAKRYTETEFFVAPDGNDGWPGDRAKPFLTLARPALPFASANGRRA